MAEKSSSKRESVKRFIELRRIALKNGLLPISDLDFGRDPAGAEKRARQAESLRSALQEAGGGFVKIGQMLSTRDDVLGPEWREALSKLQKDVAPVPEAEVLALLEEEYGAPAGEIFESFDATPIASASIAQVHHAVLRDGAGHRRTEVAVKIRRPKIVELLERDAKIARRVARFVALTNAQARRLGIEQVVEQQSEDLMRQTDFRNEALNLAALSAVRDRSRHEFQVRLPRLYSRYSRDSVLVMDFIEGQTLSELLVDRGGDPFAATGIDSDLKRALRTVLRTFLDQLVFEGVFHADLHPGNIIITADGTPALIDFGSVGRLARDVRDTIQELFVAYLGDDTERVVDSLLLMSPLPDGADEAEFREEMATFVTYRLGPGARIDVSAVDAAIQLLSKHRLSVPAEFVAAARAFTVLEGTLRSVDPEYDILSASKSVAYEVAAGRLTRGGLGRLITTEIVPALPGLRRLPRRLEKIGAQLESGTIGFNARLLADRGDRRRIRRTVREILLSVVALVTITVGVVLLTLPAPEPEGVLSPGVGGFILCGLGVVSLLTVIASMWRADRRD